MIDGSLFLEEHSTSSGYRYEPSLENSDDGDIWKMVLGILMKRMCILAYL